MGKKKGKKVLNAKKVIDFINDHADKAKTYQEIADFVGVSKTTISNWYNGKSRPTVVQFQPLAEEYGLELEREESPDVKRKLPSQKARIISASLMFLLIASLLSALAWLSLDAKKQHGTFDIGVFGEVLKARLNTYDDHCQLDAENCADIDK